MKSLQRICLLGVLAGFILSLVGFAPTSADAAIRFKRDTTVESLKRYYFQVKKAVNNYNKNKNKSKSIEKKKKWAEAMARKYALQAKQLDAKAKLSKEKQKKAAQQLQKYTAEINKLLAKYKEYEAARQRKKAKCDRVCLKFRSVYRNIQKQYKRNIELHKEVKASVPLQVVAKEK